MALTVIADPTVQGLIEGLNDKIASDAVIVQLELPPNRAAYGGLDNVLELAETGQPILMLGFSTLAMLAADRRYHLAMTYSNIRFERLPLSMEEMVDMLTEMQDGTWEHPSDLLTRRALSLPQMQENELSGIRHDLGHAQNAPEGSTRRQEMDDRWMPRARKLFGGLDRDGLIAAIESIGQIDTTYAPLGGEVFENVCCDVEGTLIRPDGTVNKELLAELQEEAKNRPVTLWTGGDLKAIDKSLRKASISFPLVPKPLLRGATVAVAIDDEPQEEFCSKYGINVGEYRRIPYLVASE